MTEIQQMIVTVLVALLGSGIVQVILNRIWSKKDDRDKYNEKMISLLSELKTDIFDIRTQLIAHIEADDERNAIQCRVRIQRFNDELLHGTKHTKEHFDQILQDSTSYERYCKTHPLFLNNVTVACMDNIKATYNECMREHSFL